MTHAPTQSQARDTDMISVQRGLLAAALHCVRKHAGTESETYKLLSAAALASPSVVADEPDAGGVTVSQADLDVADELALAIAPSEGGCLGVRFARIVSRVRHAARLAGLEEAANAVERRAREIGWQQCCGHGVNCGDHEECCGDPLLMISSSEATTAIRAYVENGKPSFSGIYLSPAPRRNPERRWFEVVAATPALALCAAALRARAAMEPRT